MNEYKRNYFKVLFSIYIERMHRLVFDTYFIYGRKASKKEIMVIRYYYFLCRVFPTFRSYLKRSHEILTRAWNQKRRVNILWYLIYFRLKNINVDRYSSY